MELENPMTALPRGVLCNMTAEQQERQVERTYRRIRWINHHLPSNNTTRCVKFSFSNSHQEIYSLVVSNLFNIIRQENINTFHLGHLIITHKHLSLRNRRQSVKQEHKQTIHFPFPVLTNSITHVTQTSLAEFPIRSWGPPWPTMISLGSSSHLWEDSPLSFELRLQGQLAGSQGLGR